MTIAEEYLSKLREREPQLFPEPFRNMVFVKEDDLADYCGGEIE